MTIAGILFVAMMTIMIFFLVINSFHAILLMCAVPELWSHWQLADDEYFHALVGTDALPPISVIASLQRSPMAPVEVASMLLALDYPRFEVILVVDGTANESLGTLVAALQLYEVPPAFTVNVRTRPVRAYYRSRTHPRLLCIDMPDTTVGDALNAAANAARYPHAVAAGPNVVFERDALLRLSRPFLLDRSVACASGILRPASGAELRDGEFTLRRGRGWIDGCQTVEFLRNFVFLRMGWNRVASNIVVPSNPVMFKREHIFGMGGFDASEEVPAVDIAMRLSRYLTDNGINARMPVIPDPVAWFIVGGDLKAAGQTRRAWLRGLRRALVRNSVMLGNPEYGMFGVVALPYFWLGIIIAPMLELAGYFGLVLGLATGALDSSFAWAYLASVVGYGILLSIWSVVFQATFFPGNGKQGSAARLLAYAVVESLGYRQILLFFRSAAYLVDRQPKHTHGQPSPSGVT
jgi:cellulose synthase/poly-beta-1,6-N-acetylglucosamine synthase-like glycosyltransferase